MSKEKTIKLNITAHWHVLVNGSFERTPDPNIRVIRNVTKMIEVYRGRRREVELEHPFDCYVNPNGMYLMYSKPSECSKMQKKQQTQANPYPN